MILYTNLKNVSILKDEYNIIPILKLTSCKIKEEIILSNLKTNKFLGEKDKETLKHLFKESQENNFEILIEKSL